MQNSETMESASKDSAIPKIEKQEEQTNLYKNPQIDFFDEFGHLALIGPTNSGKTTRMKIFFCDENFRKYDMFIYVGQEKDIQEMATCFAAGNYLQHDDYKSKKMEYFELSKIEQAIVFCQNRENDFAKLLFIDDALLQGTKSIKHISTFISQAKNYHTTVCVTMHASTGDNTLKNIRSACRYWVFMNALPQEIVLLTKIKPDDKLILHYNNLSKFDKVIIFDREQNNFFNKEYRVFKI